MNQNIESVLRNVRSKAETKFEEQNFIKELLNIIYNRFESNSFSNGSIGATFAALFLQQMDLQIDEKTAFEEFQTYQRLKAMKYKPHIKLIIHSVKLLSSDPKRQSKLWPTIDDNEEHEMEISIMTRIDGQKTKKKLSYQTNNLYCNNVYEINSEFIYAFHQKSTNISIVIAFNRHRNNWNRLLCYFFNGQKVICKETRLEPFIDMPLIGMDVCLSTQLANEKYKRSPFSIDIDLSLEFCDEPKRTVFYKKEKLLSHKRLLLKSHNRWQEIPPQMKAILEMNRQQNGITKDENLLLQKSVFKQINQLKEANELRKHFIDLINRAPNPESSNLMDDNDNNNDYSNDNNNNLVPLLKDPQFCRFSSINKKIAEFVSQ